MVKGKKVSMSKFRAVGVSFLVATLLLLSIPTGVAGESSPPHRFIGTAYINNATVSKWTEVSAWVHGVQCAYTYTGSISPQADPEFRIDVPAYDPATGSGAQENETIVFKVAGITANETRIFHSGGFEVVNLHAVTPPISLIFLTDPQTITAGQPSAVMMVQLRDENNTALNVVNATILKLVSTSAQGRFSESDTSWSDVASVTMLSGQNSVSFYYKDTIAGTPTITVAEFPSKGWRDATQQETITPLSAGRLEVTGSATMTAGSSNELTIRAKDQYGNVATGYSGGKLLTFSGPGIAPGGQSPTVEVIAIGNPTTVDFVSGVSSAGAATLVAYKVETTTVDVSDGNINSFADPAYDLDLTVNSASASRLEVSGSATMVANSTNELTIRAKDAYGNLATGYSGAKNLTFSGPGVAPGGQKPTVEGVFIGNRTGVNFSSGVSITNAATLVAYKAETTVVNVNDTSINSTGGYGLSLIVTAAAATRLDVTGISDPVAAGIPSDVTVTARDAYGNMATGYRGTIYFTSNDTQATLPGNYTFTVDNNGVKTFSGGVVMMTVGERWVKATDTITATITGNQTGITVTAAGAVRLEITGSATMTAGGTNELTIRAKDAYGNIVTTYTGMKNLTFSGPGIAPGGQAPTVEGTVVGNLRSVTFTNGTSNAGAATLIAYKAETTVVNVSDGSIGSSGGYGLSLTVSPATISKLVFITPPQTITAGQPSVVMTVQTQDAYSNPSNVSGANATLTLSSTSAQKSFSLNATSWVSITSVTIAVGQNSASFYYKDNLVGTPTITVSKPTTPVWTSATQQETISPASASTLVVAGITNPVVAGTASNVTVTAKDAYGNTDTNYSGTLYFTSSDTQATLPANYTFVAENHGVRTFSGGVTMKTVGGGQWVRATDTVSGITGNQSAITVTPAAAYRLEVSGNATMTAGGTNELTIRAKDPYGNLATGYNGTKTLTFSGPAVAPGGQTATVEGTAVGSPRAVIFTSGVSNAGAATLIAYKAETTVVNVSDSSLNINSTGGYGLSLTVNAASASRLEVTGGGTMTAGNTNEMTVTAKDAYGNIATGYSGANNLTFSGPGTAPGGQKPTVEGVVIGNVTSVSFTAGVSAASAATLIAYKAETTTVDVSDGSINSAANPAYDLDLTVIPASAAWLEVTGSATMVANSTNELTIRAKDAYGNLATGYSGAKNLTFSGPLVAPGGQPPTVEGTVIGNPTAMNFTSGVSAASAATLIAYKAETTSVDVSDGSINSFASPAYDLDLTVSAAAISKLAFTTTSQTIMAGQASAVMMVQSQDAYGNPSNVAANTTLTLNSTSVPGLFSRNSTSWVNTTNVTIPNGQNSAGFYYKDTLAGTPTITVAKTGWTSASQPETISPAAAARLEVTGSATITAGVTNELTIRAKDQYGNLATGYSGARNLTFSGPGVSPDGQPPTVAGIVMGSPTSVSFTAGVSNATAATLIAYKAETTTVNVSDDGINSSGYGLSLTVNAASASRLEVTGNATMAAGGTNELTIRAKDAYGNLATGYSGAKNLTFSGLGVAPGGQPPKVENVVIGSATPVNFTAGASAANAATLNATKAETTVVNVSDGGISSSGYGLALTVNPAAISQLVFTTPSCIIATGEASAVMTVQTRDAYGNPANVSTSTNLTLSSTSAQKSFSLNPTLWVNVTLVTIPSGQNSASFYYKDSIMGTPLITVAESPSQGWADASQQETVAAVVIVGEIDLQGRPPKGDASWVTNLMVKFFFPNGTIARTENVTTDNQGRFTIGDIATGTYDIKVKSQRTLSNLVIGRVIIAGTNPVNFGTLREGDANNDDAVTGADYSLLYADFGATSGTALDRCDFNRDGAVTAADYSLLWGNFGQTGG